MGPTVSKLYARGKTPRTLTRPYEGRTPTSPSQPAGPRIEMPVSVPRPPRQSPEAIATPVPLEEPPGQRVGSQGLTAFPKCLLRPATPAANSFMFALAIITAPALLRRLTTCAFVSGTRLLKNSEPIVVRVPAVSMLSL